VEYVVPKENWKECLPEHGYMSNITVNQMFIDKIIALKNYNGFKAKFSKIWYNILAFIIPAVVFLGWGYIFMRLIV
ncbi:MAG: hypothetical protein ACTSX6_00660, partial [Candidatus Heimdallarchaeaceae archaeon]